MPTQRDYYEILGLKKGATAAEIKSAYRKMALKNHPDRNKAKDAEEKFKEINEAYQVLSDEKKRQTYDQFGHAAFDPAAGAGSGMGGAGNPFAGGYRTGPFTWSYSTSSGGPGAGAGGAGVGGGNPFEGMDFGDPFEIFESFFGGGMGGFAGAPPRAGRPRYSLSIGFMDAALGAEKHVEIDGKKRTIKIPAGADDGTRIRFDDFDITLSVSADPHFKREGYDVYIDKEIPFTTAALGGTVEVRTLTSSLKMRVKSGTKSHSLIRLRGEGIQHLQTRGKGDLYVRLIVAVPEKLGREEKKLLEELQKIERT